MMLLIISLRAFGELSRAAFGKLSGSAKIAEVRVSLFLQTVVNIVDPIQIFDNRVECGCVDAVFGVDLK